MDRAEVTRLARRLREAVDRALEVPDDLHLKIAGEVARIRAEAGAGADPVRIAWERTRERARRTAAVGAVTTIPSLVPVLGPAIAAFGLVADWRYVAEQQRDLVLEIAALMGVALEDPSRQVRALFLASSGASITGTQLGGAVGRTLAKQVARRGASRALPGVGAALAGGINYVATVAIGRAAIARFAAEAGMEVRGVVPSRPHPAMPELRRAVIAAVRHGRRRALESERDAIAGLSRDEREELLDVAIITALSGADSAVRGALPDGGQELLDEIASTLALPAGEVDAGVRRARRNLRRLAAHLSRRLGEVGKDGRSAASRLWRSAGDLARRWPLGRGRGRVRHRASSAGEPGEAGSPRDAGQLSEPGEP